MATAVSPDGPWTEKGLVVTSASGNTRQTNAIDPTVITTATGEQYMYYGSAWDGIYILKLDPSAGLAFSSGDKGTRIANRGYTGGKYNGNADNVKVERERDWENKIATTLVFAGLNNQGAAVWGEKR
jgi:arabinan endo-1,5-alpha-L-arabinosidase